jgi:hypothetical protein
MAGLLLPSPPGCAASEARCAALRLACAVPWGGHPAAGDQRTALVSSMLGWLPALACDNGHLFQVCIFPVQRPCQHHSIGSYLIHTPHHTASRQGTPKKEAGASPWTWDPLGMPQTSAPKSAGWGERGVADRVYESTWRRCEERRVPHLRINSVLCSPQEGHLGVVEVAPLAIPQGTTRTLVPSVLPLGLCGEEGSAPCGRQCF